MKKPKTKYTIFTLMWLLQSLVNGINSAKDQFQTIQMLIPIVLVLQHLSIKT